MCIQLTLKCWDSVLDREDCLAANSRSMGPQQQNTDDQNCSVDRQRLEKTTQKIWLSPSVPDDLHRFVVSLDHVPALTAAWLMLWRQLTRDVTPLTVRRPKSARKGQTSKRPKVLWSLASRCVCVRRAAYITYRLHAALVSTAKIMRCIKCSLVLHETTSATEIKTF